MSEFLGSAFWLVVTLGLLITFHEYGHFVVARRCGVKVLRFSVGFGKALFGWTDRHGTEFVVAAIPLGGYVKMLDEREFDTELSPADAAQSFNRAPVGKRIAITAAGPVANLIFAVAAFWLMFVIGKPDYQPVVGRVENVAAQAGLTAGERVLRADGADTATWTDLSLALLKGAMEHRAVALDTVDAGGGAHTRTLALNTLTVDPSDRGVVKAIGLYPRHWSVAPIVGEVPADGAAAAAGLRTGDRLLAIGGETVADWSDVPRLIQAKSSAERPLVIRFDRAGATQTVEARPRQDKDADGKPVWKLGVANAASAVPPPDAVLRYGPLAAVPQAFAATWSGVKDSFDLIGKMVTGAISTKNLSGVVGIAQAANASASMGLTWFINFLALISISLAVLNLLPIPVLDGGHLLYYLVELIRGRPVSERVQIAAQYVGLFLIVALMSLALYNDVFHIASRG